MTTVQLPKQALPTGIRKRGNSYQYIVTHEGKRILNLMKAYQLDIHGVYQACQVVFIFFITKAPLSFLYSKN